MQFLSYDMRTVCEANTDDHVSITVAYKRLKTMENYKLTTDSNYRALTGKIMVFWICGRT